jgi:hypothetical protein
MVVFQNTTAGTLISWWKSSCGPALHQEARFEIYQQGGALLHSHHRSGIASNHLNREIVGISL